jgi:phage-related baseplate assembly protein
MPGGYTAIDLSQLPAPSIVEPLDYETIRTAMLADLVARMPSFSALLESDPVVKLVEVCAYRELLIRQRVNDACRGVMIAKAVGSDLDHLAALFAAQRLQLTPGDAAAIPPVAPTFESDADFRRRVQLSLEGFSTAGPIGAYIYHALSADPDVLDASATSPLPGDVVVTVLSRTGSGAASPALVAAVQAALSADDVRPLCDTVGVQSATIVNWHIAATLTCYPGPDRAVILAAAQAAAQAYAADQHRLGRDVTLSGIYAALHRPGVQRVALVNPVADIVIADHQASWCTAITLTDGGVGE